MIAHPPVAHPGTDAAALVAQAAELAVAIDEVKAQALIELGELIRYWNQAVNLVSRADIERLVPRHLLDSLTVTPWLTGSTVLDVGTGAGLPGLPLAIAREDAHFTLIDLSERKIRFVDRAVRALGLSNVSTWCGDVRGLEADAGFDTIVCRGVADAGTVWPMVSQRLTSRGRVVVMSRAQGGRAGPSAGPAAPRGARLEARPQVRVPGLDRPHELTVLRHAREVGGGV